ncbi:MAG: 23S rRNA (adenine(2503)-C(2))-methyltransferase RlmN [Paludibacteraceae bacterium]|nr:23S rRNA (adenine(2503)-C(2))-methyltransferase RlmN [Paludibacteraceae bacterium]
MKTLLGSTLAELKGIVSQYGLPAFTAKQIADWLYKKRIRSIDEMTNLSQKARIALSKEYTVGATLPAQTVTSADGTEKYLFEVGDKRYIESVLIPEKDRATLCISSQIGCQMNCLFCATGKQGYAGNLTVAEILNQVQSIQDPDRLTNIVFMGMGEPLNNHQAVLKAIEIMTADYGYGWSPKRITVSTVGILPHLPALLDKTTCHVAISVHAPSALERRELCPVEKVYPINDVISLLKQYDWSHQRKLSIEYTLFDQLNDTQECANKLADMLRGLHCHVNLIPFHQIPQVGLLPTPWQGIEQFQNWLVRRGVSVTIRKSRGQDIDAACGMLSTKKNNAL